MFRTPFFLFGPSPPLVRRRNGRLLSRELHDVPQALHGAGVAEGHLDLGEHQRVEEAVEVELPHLEKHGERV